MQRILNFSLKFSGALLLLLVLIVSSVRAQTTSFTYQGRLTDNVLPANGFYDFQFKLFDAAAGGTQVGATVTPPSSIQVSTGLFTVTLDFGAAAFPGALRWLEISAKQMNSGTFTTLTPRQPITSTPYAVRSLNATTADNATQLNGQSAAQYVLTNDPRLSDARPPTAGSGNYIQNTTNQQANGNFNISGTGTVNTLNATVVNTAGALTGGYKIGGDFILRSPGGNSLLVGPGTSTAGDNNTFVGVSAGANTTGGGGNVFVGKSAGFTNATGTRNTIIGTNTQVKTNNLVNATAIGANATVDCSNCLVLGSVFGENGGEADAKVGIGTDKPDAPELLQVDGDIRIGVRATATGCVKNGAGSLIIGTCSSDLRFKQKITPFPNLLDKISRLQPVHYFWRATEHPQKHFGNGQTYGLIAQEVETVLPELVSEDKQGYKMVDYGKLPLLLLQSVRELKQENDALQQTNTALHQQNAELQKRISAVEQKLETLLKR